MENALKIDCFYYQNLFEGLSMTIEKNTFSAISGPNNCGKTTLMRILNRDIIVDSDIEINNQPINSYSIREYSELVDCVIPFEKIPEEETVEEEMWLYAIDEKEIEEIAKGLKISSLREKKIKELSPKEFIYYQIAIALIHKPKILLIDSLSSYLEVDETIQILKYLKKYQEKHDITILYTTIHLEESLLADTLWIIDEKRVVLKGSPIEILQKDNTINKIGLNIPFMMDLSVKLKDYELIEEPLLEKDRMVDELWK